MEGLKPAISLSDNALKHLSKMRSERGEDLCLRIGVKQGGCSGMSYTMDFENRSNARPDDSTIEYEGFTIGNYSITMQDRSFHSDIIRFKSKITKLLDDVDSPYLQYECQFLCVEKNASK